MMNQICMHCFVSGKVQGVWYRASAKIEADKLGITGWAKNLADGRVEVLVSGDKETLELFYNWLKQGSRLANVTDVTREEAPLQVHDGFSTF